MDSLVMISSGMRAVLCQFWGTVVDASATLDGINFKSNSENTSLAVMEGLTDDLTVEDVPYTAGHGDYGRMQLRLATEESSPNRTFRRGIQTGRGDRAARLRETKPTRRGTGFGRVQKWIKAGSMVPTYCWLG
ncbi:hypothetical protein BKA59DRAFT_450437 [Fusarium tricinctum]|uniref:Uncharacterized protein n=1 Tax=Fusarium tricinctum TaxID=61284 RepID=A0A8K0S449_9HYPO|nr:hypothetical protein BKA59DRAFT_450437 [Fusarium tricinctum]